MRSDLGQFGVVCQFLSDRFSDMESLLEQPEDMLVKEMKKWLMKNGRSVTSRHTSKRMNKDKMNESVYVRYLRKAYKFLEPEDNRPEREKDVWRLDKLGLMLTDNPIKNTETLNFTKIHQDGIRQEVKDASYMELQTRAVGTVCAELVAVNRFSSYLAENFVEVHSLADVDRAVLPFRCISSKICHGFGRTDDRKNGVVQSVFIIGYSKTSGKTV